MDGDCDTAMVVITVNPVNDVPVAVDDTNTTNEDSPVSGNLASNDTPSGDGSNTWSAVGTPSNGNVVVNPNGTFTYTPNANFNGADTFYYKVCDVDGDCDTAMVVITVNPVNDVPVAVDDSNTTNEDSPVSGNLASNDTPSGDGGNTWSAVGTPSNGNVVVNPNGTYTYTPNANFNGADTFYYKVCDVDGDCDTSKVVITVNPVNDVPVAVDDNFTTTLDVAVSGNLSTNDNGSTDGGNNWSLTINPTNGLVSVLTDGTFTYTPSPGFAGNDTFYYRVCDVDGDCDTAMVVITVNDAPIAVDDVNSTNEDTPVSGDLSTNDTPSANGGNTWSAVGTPTNGNVLINPNGTYTYTPNADFNGNDTFYYRVCDVDGDCDTAMVVITVNPDNDVPLAVADINTTIENSSVSGDLSPNDIPSGDGGNTWSAVVAPTNGNVVINPNGTYTYTPNTNFNGNDTFYYRVCDVDGDCDTSMVVITVNPVVPVAVNDSNTTLQNTPVNGTVITNDILSGNGGNTWSLITAANNGIILLNTDGTYTYTPNTDFYGLDTFHYRLCDVDGDCDTAIVVILIQPNHPVATDDDNVTNENTPVNGNLSTNDTPSGDGGNTWSLITPPTNGNVILNPDGTYTYTPNLNFNGADTFTYKVCDINGDCDTARVIIQITGTTPVKDLYLTANAANGQLVNLTWRVSCETEVDRYVLERSNDGVRFETATQVNSRAGCTPTTYKIADRLSKPFTSLYYRVKAIEMNGQFTYSNIALVKGNSDDFVMVSPNPFTDKLNIEFFAGLNEKANAQIYSMQGQILKSMSWTTLPGYNKVMMQGLGQLPAGSYILKLQVNGKMIQSSTLIK